MTTIRKTIAALLMAALLPGCSDRAFEPTSTPIVSPESDWVSFGGSRGGGHYAKSRQITPGNVHQLQPAWQYRSGDFRGYSTSKVELAPGIIRDSLSSAWQMTPILVDGTLYGCTALNRVFALDPVSGAQKWIFDPEVDHQSEYLMNCRGVSSWKSASDIGAFCSHRIIAPTMDGRLIALDATSGKPCTDFGQAGQIDLTSGLGEVADTHYNITSPPAIIGDLVITGAMHMDRVTDSQPSGVVRAFDVRTGDLQWYWDALPPDLAAKTQDDDGAPKFTVGTSNVWSIMSVDEERDMVFLPTGNTSTDFFGGQRDGLDYYSSSVVALRASTGEVIWHQQFVHHDIWDYDTPSQPTLFDFERDGVIIPAIAQPTKMGLLYLLNRETGEPLFGIEERPVPTTGNVSDEYLSPTQPFPIKPQPLHPLELTADDAWGLTFWDENACRDKISALRNEGIYTPPSVEGSMFFPSDFGGNNWGSPAIDPERNLLVMTSLFMPASLTLIPREDCNAGEDPMIWPQSETPYCLRADVLKSPLGMPCSEPPWGTLVALDLQTAEKRWEVPLGNLEELAPWPVSQIKGSAIAGGPSITAGGLVFVAATSDMYIRAFDSESGEELWRHKLPTGGHAVPMSYQVGENGKQYVVIAAGGHYGMPHEPPGDWLIAFALPD